MEIVGLDPEVRFHLNKMLSAKLCPSVVGQVSYTSCVSNFLIPICTVIECCIIWY